MVDHLGEAKALLASAPQRGTGLGGGYDHERLAAAQTHALIAVAEVLVAWSERERDKAAAEAERREAFEAFRRDMKARLGVTAPELFKGGAE